MPDRLAELQRQRALLQEHLAWLDREIAAETSSKPARTFAAENPAIISATVSGSSPTADAQGIIAQYASKPASLKDHVRKGCFLYFAFALFALALAVAAVYWHVRGRH
jgi:CHASE3 domain sensor protein